MAIHAVAHLKRPHLPDLGHPAHVTVAKGTGLGGHRSVDCREITDVWLVYKADVVGNAVDANPVDRLVVSVEVAKLLDLGQVVPDGLVARHAEADRRDSGGGALGYVPVAEGTVEPDVDDVHGVREGDGLGGAVVEAKYGQRPAEPGRQYEGYQRNRGNSPNKSSEAQHPKQEGLASGGPFELEVAW